MEFYVSKVDGCLIAVDDESAEKLASLGLDQLVECKVNANRNYKNLQRFNVFIDKAFAMQEIYKDRNLFRKMMQMGGGHFDLVQSPRGQWLKIPKSISFAEMEEEEFKIIFKKCIDYFLEWRNENKKLCPMTNEEFIQILDFT